MSFGMHYMQLGGSSTNTALQQGTGDFAVEMKHVGGVSGRSTSSGPSTASKTNEACSSVFTRIANFWGGNKTPEARPASQSKSQLESAGALLRELESSGKKPTKDQVEQLEKFEKKFLLEIGDLEEYKPKAEAIKNFCLRALQLCPKNNKNQIENEFEKAAKFLKEQPEKVQEINNLLVRIGKFIN